MRTELKHLQTRLQRIDVGHTSDAIEDVRQVLYQMLELLDIALPIDKSDDD